MTSAPKQLSLTEMFAQRHDKAQQRVYNLPMVIVCIALISIGFVLITSASLPIAERLHGNPYYFSVRHTIYIVIAMIAGLVTLSLPMQFWRVINPYLLLLSVALLAVVLAVGTPINGAKRWIRIGPATIQVAEMAKLFFFLYLAGYMVRRYEQVQENIRGFFKPLIVFFVLAGLLLFQPDFGTVVVMFTTTLGLLFLAGAKLWQFFAIIFAGLSSIVLLIVTSEYRKARITGFLNPWEHQFGDGYQLTQSLMAYGRGSWSGNGLGNSLQKLEFLPEAHTDFVMAILAEELGFIGVMVVLLLLLYLVISALRLGNAALAIQRPFEAFVAYAIGIWFCLQTLINIGGSTGMLPSKGLTLPLVSYGGSSLIIMVVAVSILLRIDFEIRVANLQALPKAKKRKARKVEKADDTTQKEPEYA